MCYNALNVVITKFGGGQRMKPTVSVVVPSYNIAPYLEECIKSIINQSYSNWEIIIVNDGSTDNTGEIAHNLATTDPRIRVIDKENGGVSSARNCGLKAALGDYVSFLDGDDVWLPDFLEKVMSTALETGAGAVYTGFNRLYSNGFVLKYHYQYPSGSLLIPKKVRFHIGAMTFKKEILQEYNITFTEGCPVGEDWEFIAKVLVVTNFAAVPENLMIYRQRQGSALHRSYDWRRHIHGVLGYQRAIEFMEHKLASHPNREQVLLHHKHQLGILFCKLLWRMVKNGGKDDFPAVFNKYKHYLNYLNWNKLKTIEKLKFRLVLSENPVYRNMIAWICSR